MVVGAVLAAGAGRRFGTAGPKQLARLDGRPLLEHALAAALAARSLDAVAVVLGARTEQIASGCDLDGAEIVRCPDWAAGQSRSLRAAVAWASASGADALVITLGDQPLIDPAAIDAVVAARTGAVDCVQATYDGRRGHPTLLAATVFDDVAALDGDEGARTLLPRLRSATVACPGSPLDVDTPSELARIAAR